MSKALDVPSATINAVYHAIRSTGAHAIRSAGKLRRSCELVLALLRAGLLDFSASHVISSFWEERLCPRPQAFEASTLAYSLLGRRAAAVAATLAAID